MQSAQLINISLEELATAMERAAEKGAADALAAFHKAHAPAVEITKPEAMDLAGYKDNAAFSLFLKRNKIYSSGKGGKFNLYKRDEIVNAKHPKGKHI
jgi:hypothetical protein